MKKDITHLERTRQKVEKDYLILCWAAKLLGRPQPKLKQYVDENGVIEWMISCKLKGVLTYEFDPNQRKSKSSK